MVLNFILTILLTSSALAEQLPQKATVIAKASTICGSEDTYFVADDVLKKGQIDTIKWILDYTLTESSVGDFDFGEDTGRSLKAGELNQFLQANPISKNVTLKTKLQDLQKIKAELQALRDQKIQKAHSNEKVKAVVNSYWKSKAAITTELEKQFNLKTADTGASCD